MSEGILPQPAPDTALNPAPNSLDPANSALSSTDPLADLKSTIEEQNQLIRLLVERVGALEGRAFSLHVPTNGSAPMPDYRTQIIPGRGSNHERSDIPSQSNSLDGRAEPISVERTVYDDPTALQAKLSSPSLAPEDSISVIPSNSSTPSPLAPLRHEAPPFSPMLSPPSGYYYGPHPGYCYPMHPMYPPPNWHALANHLSVKSGPPESLHPNALAKNDNSPEAYRGSNNASTNNFVAPTLDQWGSEPANSWGEPSFDSAQKSSSSPNTQAKSTTNAQSTKKGKSKVKPCNYGNECTRLNCWFEHPSDRVEPQVQHNDNPNSKHTPSSKASHTKTTPSSSEVSKQPRTSTKSKPECKYADKCTRENCWFTHPPSWSPPNHLPESTPDQPTPVPSDQPHDQDWAAPTDNEQVVDDGGWDTGNQQSAAAEETWDVKPTNDWGVPVIDSWGPSASYDWGAPANDWANPVANAATTQAPGPANKSKKASPVKKPEVETQKGKTHSTESREGTDSPARPQSVLSTFTAQPETAKVADDTIAESSTDPSAFDSNIEPPIADLVVDSLNTPSLEPASTPTRSSSLSEAESLSTPFAWGDEPLNDTGSVDPPTEGQVDLDSFAPSSMYTSWAPIEVSDWGPMPTDPVGPTSVAGAADHASQTDQVQHTNAKPSAKAKGKRKETRQEEPRAVPPARSESEPTVGAGPSAVSTDAVQRPPAQHSKSEPPPVPEGVPEDQIPDWLLGNEEDSYAALGLSRPASPNPGSTPKPSLPRPRLDHPRLSQMPGESFPAIPPLAGYQPPKTSVASGPTIQPVRRAGWSIISTGEGSTSPEPQSTPKRGGRGAKKNYGQKKKEAGKSSK